MSDTPSPRREALFYTQKNGWDLIDADEKALVAEYCEGYKLFLDASRTERMAVREAVRLAAAAGFAEYTPGMPLAPGSRIYSINRAKAVYFAVIGKKPLAEGCVVAAAHIDSPRLDLKQLPLYEESELAYFKTHYYGGIRKYQWTALPLELHGAVALKTGEVIDISIGADAGDPVFVITDLLPHLAQEQSKKTLSEAFSGEGLNILIGSAPDKEEGENRVKLAILDILSSKYNMTEADFLSAELTATPSLPTRDIGLDRSLIGGYGHDDRVCSFAALKAICESANPEYTSVCLLADKEEIGSEGATGMKSEAFESFMAELCETQRTPLRRCFQNSLCISADVCNGFDPNYPEVSEKRNSAKLGYGVALVKFTGSRGKSGSNDASAEVVSKIRRAFDNGGVVWQMAELGKVDAGGGGTVAMYMAKRNIDTIDAGVPVLSMHSPFETVSKLDCYMTYKAIKSVYSLG